MYRAKRIVSLSQSNIKAISIIVLASGTTGLQDRYIVRDNLKEQVENDSRKLIAVDFIESSIQVYQHAFPPRLT